MRQSAILPEGGTEELGCGKVPSSDDEIPPRAWQTQVAGQEFGWRVPPSGVQAGSERHQRSKSGACPETSKDAVKELRRFLAKNLGIAVSALSVFEVMFYAMFLQGQVLVPLLCGFPLGLILVALLWQCAMHFLGYGTMVMNGNEIE